jgi:hypothetical protein
MEFEHVTTNAAVERYVSSTPIFEGILREVRELSRKKPEATMSAGRSRSSTVSTLIPLTQVRLYVVAAWRRIAARFSSDCLA